MINNSSFFRFPFHPFYHNYSPKMPFPKHESIKLNSSISSYSNSYNHTEIENVEKKSYENNAEKRSYESNESIHKNKPPTYYNIGPISINTLGFSDKNKPILFFSNQYIYLDDLIILALLYFLYKEDVNDPMLFTLLILLL